MIANIQTDCNCYECVGPIRGYDEYGQYVKNNLKYHTHCEPCADCGRPKTEYRDLGTKGYFECWYCTARTADGEVRMYE